MSGEFESRRPDQLLPRTLRERARGFGSTGERVRHGFAFRTLGPSLRRLIGLIESIGGNPVKSSTRFVSVAALIVIFVSPAALAREDLSTFTVKYARENVDQSRVLQNISWQGHTDRVRFAAESAVPREVTCAAAESGVPLLSARVLAEGRIELLHYLREQSLCMDYHRYGNLGPRSEEQRAPVA